jgi:hypothetical protein
MTTEATPGNVPLSDQLGLATERAKLRELAIGYLAWQDAGCPVEDRHDTYPNELWSACADPRRVLALLDEIDRLRTVAENTVALLEHLTNSHQSATKHALCERVLVQAKEVLRA